MKFKKIIAVALAAVMAAAALMISASAESIADTAKSRKSGDSFTIKLADGTAHDYKIKLTKSGDLEIKLTSAAQQTCISVYDADGNTLSYSKSASSATTGSINSSGECDWNNTLEKFKGTVVYKDLDKGTYYIRIKRDSGWFAQDRYSGQGKATIKFVFPGESADSDNSDSMSNVEISALQLTLEEDDDILLSAVTNGSGTVKWSSSDESVATVSSKGKVRAKSVGTAVITAKCGKSTAKIQIKVVEDD